MNDMEIKKKGSRIYFLDNLRSVIIFLVIIYHAGGVYESTGLWASFWIIDDPSTNNTSGLINLILDIFMMPTLFFISGYLAPASVKTKNWKAFTKTKFKRLIIPWLIAVLTLIPLYKVIFLFSRNLPQEHISTYFHITNPNSQNWLWFLPVLFAFNIIYLFFSKSKIKAPDISFKGAVLGIFLFGFIYSLGMDLLGLRGWTLTPILDFQNERILIYFMFFLLGANSFHVDLFGAKPSSRKLYIIVNSISWIPINVYIFFLLFPFVISPGNYIFSKIIDRSILWLSFHLSLICFVYVFIETFRRYFNTSGKIWNELNPNSYTVYIIHVIMIGGIALALLETTIPSLLKHFILAISAFFLCNCIISFHHLIKSKINFAQRFLNGA